MLRTVSRQVDEQRTSGVGRGWHDAGDRYRCKTGETAFSGSRPRRRFRVVGPVAARGRLPAVRRAPRRRFLVDADGRCRGARTDCRVPRPGHRLANVDRVPPGRDGRRAAVAGHRGGRRPSPAPFVFPAQLRGRRRRDEQLEDGRGRDVRRVCPAGRHRGRAPWLQRGRRMADQILVPERVRPAVPKPVYRLHVLLRLSQLLFELGVHRFFQGECRRLGIHS